MTAASRRQRALPRWIPAICSILLVATIAPARTWLVERDGSGDSVEIQKSVDAAASGDTIRIGPGRFDERRFWTFPGWSDSVYVVVDQHELTLIGSGPETIIGPQEAWEPEQANERGIVTATFLGNAVLRIENLRIENVYRAVEVAHEVSEADTVAVRACHFFGTNRSLMLVSNRGVALIADCSFVESVSDGGHISLWNQSNARVEDCISTLQPHDGFFQKHITMMGVLQAVIEGNVFEGGFSGATVSDGSSATFTNCLFDGQSGNAIFPSIGSIVAVDRCRFRELGHVIVSYGSNHQVSLTNSVIESVSDASFYIANTGSFTVRDCDLAGGDDGIVHCWDQASCDGVQTLDFTDNYWGTDDPDSIQAWIRDNHDSPDACYIIDYEPFRTESTPVRRKSLGDVKGMFR
jgi:hypothetical protein